MDVEIIKSKLEEALQQKTCLIHPVVAVIETIDNKYVLGWNGPATRELAHDRCLREKYAKKGEKHPTTTHAEIRTICNAAKQGIATQDGTMYLNGWFCCDTCAGTIANAGLIKFVTPDEVYSDKKRHILVPELKDHPYYNFKRAEEILRYACVEIIIKPAIKVTKKL